MKIENPYFRGCVLEEFMKNVVTNKEKNLYISSEKFIYEPHSAMFYALRHYESRILLPEVLRTPVIVCIDEKNLEELLPGKDHMESRTSLLEEINLFNPFTENGFSMLSEIIRENHSDRFRHDYIENGVSMDNYISYYMKPVYDKFMRTHVIKDETSSSK